GLLARFARSAFISGMDLGLLVAAIVVLAAALLALLALPSRPAVQDEASGPSGPTDGAGPI
ncbi:MAG TPA: hypothetical protein VK252_10195, partial [Solirubrobacteraceae bacterium]|nr:hypothetical protein [Solirubrobacteraceae bacterium]